MYKYRYSGQNAYSDLSSYQDLLIHQNAPLRINHDDVFVNTSINAEEAFQVKLRFKYTLVCITFIQICIHLHAYIVYCNYFRMYSIILLIVVYLIFLHQYTFVHTLQIIQAFNGKLFGVGQTEYSLADSIERRVGKLNVVFQSQMKIHSIINIFHIQ